MTKERFKMLKYIQYIKQQKTGTLENLYKLVVGWKIELIELELKRRYNNENIKD